MTIQELIQTRSELTDSKVEPAPVVISTRIRLARNFATFPFPGRANESQRLEVLDSCLKVVSELGEMDEASVWKIEGLGELDRQVLVERRLVSRELSEAANGAGVVISNDQACSVMINEEDHLRIQMLKSGFHLKDVWETIDRLDSEIEQRIDYAFSDEFGYLTACPTNVGTGMRASVMMHLPGLVLISNMEKVIRGCNQLGMAVRGVLGEGSEASGSVFQISNQQTLGESEEEILNRLNSVLSTIIRQELNARETLMEQTPRKILDKIGRAYGTLRNAQVINSSEALNLLSLIRLAVDLGLLPEENRRPVDRLFIESQPGHIQFFAKQEVEPDERDARRADMLRENFRNMPPLDFDKFVKNPHN